MQPMIAIWHSKERKNLDQWQETTFIYLGYLEQEVDIQYHLITEQKD